MYPTAYSTYSPLIHVCHVGFAIPAISPRTQQTTDETSSVVHTYEDTTDGAAALILRDTMSARGFTTFLSVFFGIAGGIIAIVFSVFLGQLSDNARGHVDLEPRCARVPNLCEEGSFFLQVG